MTSITFTVRYQLGEYIVVSEGNLLEWVNNQRREAGKTATARLPPWQRWPLKIVLVAVFFYKIYKVGNCQFTIDAKNIKRQSKNGEMVLPWDNVIAVSSGKVAWLIHIQKGAVLVPRRCLSAEQAEALTGWIGGWQEEIQPVLVKPDRP